MNRFSGEIQSRSLEMIIEKPHHLSDKSRRDEMIIEIPNRSFVKSRRDDIQLKTHIHNFFLSSLPVVALVIATTFSGCQSSANEKAVSQPVKAKVEKLEKVTEQEAFTAVGTVSSSQHIKLSFKTGGIVKSIFVEEGNRVEVGQMLAQLNLSEHQSKLAQAQTGFEKAGRDLERVENLYADTVATLEQLQDARSNLEIQRSNLQIAQFNFDYGSIRAPATGKIMKQLAEENELVGPGIPVFVFSTGEKNWVLNVGVSEEKLVQIEMGDSASIEFSVYKNRPFPAMISAIAEAIDPQSSSYEIELKLEQTAAKLVTGFTGEATIFPNRQLTYFKLPPKALAQMSNNQGEILVYEVQSKTAKIKLVEIVELKEEFIAVFAEGLENANVIIEKQGRLKEGMAVEVVGE